MKLSTFRTILTLLMLIVFLTASVGFAEDYLVIKKKSGPTQKVPLNFPPDQIESFQVESGPNNQPSNAGAQLNPPGGAEKGAQTPSERPAVTSDEGPVDTSGSKVPTQEPQAFKKGPQIKQGQGPGISGPTRHNTPGPEKAVPFKGPDQSQTKPSVGVEQPSDINHSDKIRERQINSLSLQDLFSM